MTKQYEPIRVWDRELGREVEEQVYGEGGVRFMYGTSVGRGLGELLLSRRWFSKLYGWLQSTRWSGRKVTPFIARYGIPMDQYEPGPFQTFNDFFVRGFRSGARNWTAEPTEMPAFAEARYFAWSAITDDQTFPVKGRDLSAAALLAEDRRFDAGFRPSEGVWISRDRKWWGSERARRVFELTLGRPAPCRGASEYAATAGTRASTADSRRPVIECGPPGQPHPSPSACRRSFARTECR